MDPRAVVERAIRTGEGLPPAPPVMGRIQEICRNPEATARDLGGVIQLDPALTTRVLKRVNSTYYGLSSTIRTVTHAVVILGFEEIKSIVLAVPVAKLFRGEEGREGIDIRQLWNDSVEIACLARALAYHIRHPIPEQVFVAGILSDTGMVVMNHLLGARYAEVVDLCVDDDFLPEIEEAELGISHVEVGRTLARKWKFPPELIQTIRRHHDPIEEGEDIPPETGLVYVARRLRSAQQAGEPLEETLAGTSPVLIEALALTPDAAQKAHARAASEFQEAKGMLDE